MNDELLLSELYKNVEIIYDENLDLEVSKLSIRYSKLRHTLYVFGEINGVPYKDKIYVRTEFNTLNGIYNESDDINYFSFDYFQGIKCFKCALNIDDALLQCNSIKVYIERC